MSEQTPGRKPDNQDYMELHVDAGPLKPEQSPTPLSAAWRRAVIRRAGALAAARAEEVADTDEDKNT